MNATGEKLFLVVSRIRELTPRIRAYELRSKNNSELPLVTAGSHLGIPIQLNNGKFELHKYAICSNPNQRDFYEIAVPHELDKNSSSLLLNATSVGSEFECEWPENNFHLHADASPAVLIADGIGIAGLLPIAHTLASRGRRFSLHYFGQSKTEMAFADELQVNFPRQTHFYYADELQQIDIMHVLAEAPGNTLFYACGPKAMLDNIENCARTLSISKDQIQLEHSATEKIEADKPVILELAFSNKLLHVSSDQPLLAALRNAKVPVQFDCCVGDCGTCAVKIIEGEAEHRDHVLSDAQKAEGFICVCVSRSKTEKLVLEL